jgi:SPP1 gp7 family putative phage head morphogenesis protein
MQLTRACILGKAPDNAINAIARKFKTAKSQAGRLVMTEQAYFHSLSQKEAFDDLDVEEFEIVATLDSHTSTVCQDMDGQHFPMKEYEPGMTAPPFHPWCRSVTVPYFEDNFTGERAARDAETGKTYYVPDNMDYKEWYKKFVKGGSKDDLKLSMSKVNDTEWLSKGTNITQAQYKELRDYATTKGVRLSGFKKSDVDISLTKEFIDDAAKMFDEYPELRGTTKRPFTLVLSKVMNVKDFAETTPGITHVIKLNADAMRNKNMLLEEYKKLADDGWFVKGTDYHSIIYHEIGHIIGDMRNINGLEVAKKILQTNNLEEVFEYLENNISKYSISQLDGSEIISEVFSAYKQGIESDFVLTFMRMCGIL